MLLKIEFRERRLTTPPTNKQAFAIKISEDLQEKHSHELSDMVLTAPFSFN